MSFEDYKVATVAWMKREHAIAVLHNALCDHSLSAKIWEFDLQVYYRLDSADWRDAAFRDQIIRGGVIRSSSGESIGRHDGRRVLISKADFAELQRRRRRLGPAPASQKCAAWLEKEMRDGPAQKRKSKQAFCAEAMDYFAVSKRQFNLIWKSAIGKTGVSWDRPVDLANPTADVRTILAGDCSLARC